MDTVEQHLKKSKNVIEEGIEQLLRHYYPFFDWKVTSYIELWNAQIIATAKHEDFINHTLMIVDATGLVYGTSKKHYNDLAEFFGEEAITAWINKYMRPEHTAQWMQDRFYEKHERHKRSALFRSALSI